MEMGEANQTDASESLCDCSDATNLMHIVAWGMNEHTMVNESSCFMYPLGSSVGHCSSKYTLNTNAITLVNTVRLYYKQPTVAHH